MDDLEFDAFVRRIESTFSYRTYGDQTAGSAPVDVTLEYEGGSASIMVEADKAPHVGDTVHLKFGTRSAR